MAETWTPFLNGNEDDPLRTAVHQAIGAASTCWDSEGVFMSEQAHHIAEGLVTWILDNAMEWV